MTSRTRCVTCSGPLASSGTCDFCTRAYARKALTRPSCPFCYSVDIRPRKAHYRCERCMRTFSEPRPPQRQPSKSGSGQIAGLSYRHQLARDILREHEEARKCQAS